MALLFMDGFDHVDDGYELAKWDSCSYLTEWYYRAGDGRTGGWGISCRNGNYDIQKNFPNKSTIIVGVALNLPRYYGLSPIRLMDNTSDQVNVFFTSTGAISARRGTTVLGTSDSGLFSYGEWIYVEVKAVFSNTVGSVEIRLNGVTILTVTGVNTSASGNDYCNALKLYGSEPNYYLKFDDLYICDTTGTENNDFLGDVTITTLYPTSDGNSSDFTPSTGVDNYATVDEPQLLGVTDYNSSSTIGHKDTFGMTALTGGAPILAVQTVAAVNNTTTGTINVRGVSRSGDTPADNEGSDFALSQTVKAAMDIFEKELTDDVAWTVAKVNASEFGIKIQS